MGKQSLEPKDGQTDKQIDKILCGKCIHYIPHYIKMGDDYKSSAFGHCSYPQIKVRKSDCKACAFFERKE